MFKGRTIQIGSQTGSVDDVTIYFGEWIAVIHSVNDYEFRTGITIDLQINYEDYGGGYGHDHNYLVKLITLTGSTVQIGDYTTPHIVHTITTENVTGVIIVANDNPSGFYKMSWLIEITDKILIDNPVEVIREVKKLQNWSELGVVANWGKEIVPPYTGKKAKIKVSGEGSFYDLSLEEIRALKISRQITDYNNMWTDDIVQRVCEEFFLVSYQDDNGYECLKSLLTKENPSTLITFGDTVGRIGDVIEPQSQDIFCAPRFRYAYDYATGQFTKQIIVDNVWEDSFSTAYTSGMNEYDSIEIWNICHSLWNRVKRIEPMPSSISDRLWAPDYDTAIWCLRQQLKLMTLKRCSFSIDYDIGRKWDIAKHFNLQLSHETANSVVECVVESIDKDKEEGVVALSFIILDEIDTSFFRNVISMRNRGITTFSGTNAANVF